MAGVFIELRGIAGACIVVEGQFDLLAGFRILDFQLALPRRVAILVGVDRFDTSRKFVRPAGFSDIRKFEAG